MELENKFGIKLPEDYRNFLKKYNGGYPQPDGFDFANGEDGSSVDKFLEISDSVNESIVEYFNNYKSRIPENYLPIAKDPGGNLILIGVNNTEPKVYYWDHENETEEDDIPNMNNMHLIACSFKEFIDNLYEIEI